ncbi:MAG TPA: hypothetical protein VN976_22020 [Verrucomicrobiae bacterium]|nr:hypothetical protein [Verrucomicrobiae bacterium]
MSDARFFQGDVTETLIKATELVSEVHPTDVLVILYGREKDTDSCFIKMIGSNEVTIETANWLLDKAKNFLIAEDPE